VTSKRNRRPVPEDRLDRALATVLSGTARIKRPVSIVVLSDAIKVATKGLGGLEAVADRVGISSRMLRQFLSVERLAPIVRSYFKTRKLDSVDVVAHLSTLPRSDQRAVADAVIASELQSDDVRAVGVLRRQIPDAPIRDVIDRVIDSKDVVEYVALFSCPPGARSTLRRRFEEALGTDGIKTLDIKDGVCRLIVTKTGKARLEEIAKAEKITKRATIQRIAEGAGRR
jgi:hypothetical protein